MSLLIFVLKFMPVFLYPYLSFSSFSLSLLAIKLVTITIKVKIFFTMMIPGRFFVLGKWAKSPEK